MVHVAGGSFEMRKTKVTIAAHCYDKLEVSVTDYAKCVDAGKCTAPHDAKDKDHELCNWGRKGFEKHPVNCVNHDQAIAFCAWRSARLPTEAEFEWSARGYSKGSAFPWGDDKIEDRACWGGPGSSLDDEHEGTCEVGAFPKGANPAGILDLAGNVWEWTSTPSEKKGHFIDRGGGWLNAVASRLTAFDRNDVIATQQSSSLGFRCVR
jgi:formylglycine-generating enzyme